MAREVSSRESTATRTTGAAAKRSISSKSKQGTLRLDELRARLPLSSEGRPSQLLEVVPGAHPTGAGRACSGYAALSCPGLPSHFLVPSHTWDNVTTVDFGNEPTSSWPGMFSGIRPILVPRICPEDTNLLVSSSEDQESLPALNSGIHPRQCDNDGLRSRAACFLGHAENDLDDF